MNAFEQLIHLNVNEHTDKKVTGGTALTYLSWPWAWSEVKSRFPNANYEIFKDHGLPYVCDPQTGYMVYTRVTIEGISHDMWLPVMDGANHAMKTEPYTIKTKYKEVTVAAATMTDINKTIMRCLVKNLAMFGLGLYIYAGEDLPESEEPEEPAPKQKAASKKSPAKQQEAKKQEGDAPADDGPAPAACEECGLVILPTNTKDGGIMKPEDIVALSMKRCGRVLCSACLKKALRNG